ncbi:nose resistant to fluoxetine protein 6-like [Arapaima gigas]
MSHDTQGLRMLLECSLVLLHALLCSCISFYNVSEKCMNDTQAFLLELHENIPRKYAILMYDAFGKMGSDVVGGNVNRPGSLEECLLVRGPHFNGRYCQVFIKQEPVQYFVGICVPDSCQEDEVQTLVVHEIFQKNQMSLIPPVPSMVLPQSTQAINITHCLNNDVPPDISAIICLFVCCMLISIPLLATVYVAIIQRKQHKEVSPGVDVVQSMNLKCYGTLASCGCAQTNNKNTVVVETMSEERRKASEGSHLYSFLCSFSLQKTSIGVLSTAASRGSYSSLNGIRILSLLWIICGHSVQLSVWYNLDNDKRWKEQVEKNPLYIFACSGPVYLAVDTFLLLGGLLSATSLLNSIQRADDNLSLRLVVTFVLKRLKRFQPLHIFIVCLIIGLFSVIPEGSFWFIAEDQILSCKKYWWTNLLLINNLLTITDICAPWTWYLSIDLQFYITTPLLLLIYRLNKHVLLAVATFFLLISCLTSALLTAFLRMPVHQPKMLTSEAYFQYYYNKPYTRYGPYLVGILAGIIMKTRRNRLLNYKWQAAVGWVTSLSVMLLVAGLPYVLQFAPTQLSVAHAVYQGLHRILWAMAVAWIIVACEEGYGGLINRILSLKVWVPLSNISFACYLIHPILIILYNGEQDTQIHYTDINFLYLFLGHMVLAMILGYVLTVLIEKPYLFLKGNSR